MLLKNLPPHLRNMIVKGKGSMPVHAAAVAAVQAGRQPTVGSPKVFCRTQNAICLPCMYVSLLLVWSHISRCLPKTWASLTCICLPLLAESRKGLFALQAPDFVAEQLMISRCCAMEQHVASNGGRGQPVRRIALQMRHAQSATLDSIPELRIGPMRRSQTASRALPPLQEPLLPELQRVRQICPQLL